MANAEPDVGLSGPRKVTGMDSRELALVENLLEGYAHCRLLCDQHGRPADWLYLAVNPAFERLTGLKGVVGKRASEVIPGIHQSNPELLDFYSRAARSDQRHSFETYLPMLDTWFSVASYGPEEGAFVAIFENISERKRAEAALRASEARSPRCSTRLHLATSRSMKTAVSSR